MQKILGFYAPYTSPMMSKRFQRYEVAIPLVFTLVISGLCMIPIFRAGYWVGGIVGTFTMTFALVTLYRAMTHQFSHVDHNGCKRISLSVLGQIDLGVGMIGLYLCIVVFMLMAQLTGWPPMH